MGKEVLLRFKKVVTSPKRTHRFVRMVWINLSTLQNVLSPVRLLGWPNWILISTGFASLGHLYEYIMSSFLVNIRSIYHFERYLF